MCKTYFITIQNVSYKIETLDNDQFLYNFDIILQKYNETHVNKVSISFFINKHLLFDNDVATVSNSCHFVSKARLYTAFNLIDEQFAIELFDSI